MENKNNHTMDEYTAMLLASGAEFSNKTGAFMMFVRKGYREAVESQKLKQTYLNTTYCVFNPPINIRIGGENTTLGEWLSDKGETQWAYLTAWNPYSSQLSLEENNERNKALLADLKPFRVFEGEGVGDDPSWPPEKSFFVIGIHREVAVYLGKKYGQEAIVVGNGAVEELLML